MQMSMTTMSLNRTFPEKDAQFMPLKVSAVLAVIIFFTVFFNTLPSFSSTILLY